MNYQKIIEQEVYRGAYREFIESILSARPLNEKFESSERHHIIPRCLGGSDEGENLIYLTYEEHFTAHKILAEENPENQSLFYAYWRMCNGNYECTSEEYAEARSKYVEYIKKRMQGNTYSKGNQNHLGRKFTRTHRDNLSISHLGNQSALGHTYEPTSEVRAKTSERMQGNQYASNHKHTEEWKLEQSARMKGKQNALGAKHPNRVYKFTCVICHRESIGRSARCKYCDSCKGDN